MKLEIIELFYSTHMGRARAWLRLALMQKKLADYLKVLIDHKDEALVEYFEPDALMLSDEAIVIIGILVGLNVIDCNLCVKVGLFFLFFLLADDLFKCN